MKSGGNDKKFICIMCQKYEVNCIMDLDELLNDKEMTLVGVISLLKIILHKCRIFDEENKNLNEINKNATTSEKYTEGFV